MTPREERRSGTDPAGVAGLCLVLAAIMVASAGVAQGCGPSTRTVAAPAQIGGQSPHAPAITTAEGVVLVYPVWLDLPQHAAQRAAMFDEIRTVQPEPDPRIGLVLGGVPSCVTLIVLDPGAYFALYSPTGLASGEWRAPSTLYVAWRGTSSGPTLPALPHELRHLMTNDPNAGH